MSKCSTSLCFLKSNRFQAAVVFALAAFLGARGLLPADAVLALQTVCGAHIAIRSVDRFSEKLGS